MRIKCGARVPVQIAGWLATLALTSLAFASGEDQVVKSESEFSTDKGRMVVELHRGAEVPYEVTLIKTGSNCDASVKADLRWDRAKNTLKVHLTGKRALFPNPTVERVEGVSWFPNKFIPEKQSYTDGRYQLWLLSSGAPIKMYYDPTTLDLLGSEFDFAQPPSDVVLMVPSVVALPTQFFEPKANGDVDVSWEMPYDHLTRGDSNGTLGYHLAAFPPFNLCSLDPFRFDLSQVRPYVTNPLPLDKTLSFEQFLTAGLFVDVTVEPPQYPIYPPKVTMTASISGSYVLGGAVPKGYGVDLDAQAAGVSPVIRPFAGAGQCEQLTVVRPKSTTNSCQQMGMAALMAAVQEHNAEMTGGAQ